MMYEIGDRVLIGKKRTFAMNSLGYMDIYLGKTMTIAETILQGGNFYYYMEEDEGHWLWDNEMIVKKVEENQLSVKEIFRLGDTTTVVFEDGTFSSVNKAKGDKDDDYAAFCAALAKRVYGSTSKAIKEQEKNFKLMKYKEDWLSEFIRRSREEEELFNKIKMEDQKNQRGRRGRRGPTGPQGAVGPKGDNGRTGEPGITKEEFEIGMNTILLALRRMGE